MDPYQLMLSLRENKILFQYMENSSVHYDEDKGYLVKGVSDEGTMYAYEISSGVQRLILPIAVPPEIPTEALLKIITTAQSSLEGILGVVNEGEGTFIEYYIHAIPQSEGFDSALIKFTQERREIKKGFKGIVASIKEMMANMQDMMDGRMPDGRVSSEGPLEEPTTEDIWSTMADIEKNIDDEPLPSEPIDNPEDEEEGDEEA